MEEDEEDEEEGEGRGQDAAITAAGEEQTANTVVQDKTVLNISATIANELYKRAGELVPEEYPEYVITGTSYEESSVVKNIVNSANLPFTPDTFQTEARHALANRNSVILTAPCSSGKMLVANKAVDIMRAITGVNDGVAIGFLPLTCIMEEARRASSGEVAFLTMKGDIRCEEQSTVRMSDNIDNLVSGKYKLILGHPESFDSTEGKNLLEKLQIEKKIVLVFVDEVHKYLVNHWGGSFRRDMLKVPTYVR